MPASRAISPNSRVENGVRTDGARTTVQPAANAAPTFNNARCSG